MAGNLYVLDEEKKRERNPAMRTVHSLVHWFCAQLTRSELLEAVALLQEVVAGRRDDIRLKKEFREQHPN